MKNITLFALFNISLVAMHMNASQQGQAELKLQALLNKHRVMIYPRHCPENFEMIVAFDPPRPCEPLPRIIVLPDENSFGVGSTSEPWYKPELQEYEDRACQADSDLRHASSGLNKKIRVWGVTKKSALLLNVVDLDKLHEQ